MIQVSLMASATPEQSEKDLSLFPLESLDKTGEAGTYRLTLLDPGDLFRAVDALNDRPEIRSAWLVRAETEDRGGVPPSPLFPGPVDVTSGEGYRPVESLWPGDADGDFQVTATDAVQILRASLRLAALRDLAFLRSDINRNGTLDVNDAVLSLRLAVGYGLPYPYGYPQR